MPGSLPMLDLSECGLLVGDESSISEETFATFGKNLYDVLSTSGFAYLTNHGIPQRKIEAAEEIADRFFDLSVEDKEMLYSHSLRYGYDSIYTKEDHGHSDQHEGIRMTGSAFDNDEVQWPNIPNFRSISLDLADSFKILMFRLLRALGTGMKLQDKEYFCKTHSLANKEGNISALKFLENPPVETILPVESTRIGKHSDFTSITLLLQDSNGGLQFETQAGIFEDVVPIPGTIILNVGDTLQKWSGNRLRSTVHRVVPPMDPEKRGNRRRSIIYFVEADDDVVMEPLQFEDGTKGKVDGAPMTVGQYAEKKLDKFCY